jgi:hypothetical protein
MILNAMVNPPDDTRAFARGNIVKCSPNKHKYSIGWDYAYYDQEALRLSDPLNTYEKESEDFIKKLVKR